MNERDLNILLREMARTAGLCDKWYEEWEDDDSVDKCLDRYVRGFDFCVKNDFPNLSFIRKYFIKDELHRHGIYLDEDLDISVGHGTFILLGSCAGNIHVDNFAATTLYLRHDSKVHIDYEPFSQVFITLYDNSDCDVMRDKYSIKIFNRKK